VGDVIGPSGRALATFRSLARNLPIPEPRMVQARPQEASSASPNSQRNPLNLIRGIFGGLGKYVRVLYVNLCRIAGLGGYQCQPLIDGAD
jgi:hypothetical protein